MLTGDLVVQAAWQEGAELAAFRIGFAESLLLQHCLEEALQQILCHVRIVALAAQVAIERQRSKRGRVRLAHPRYHGIPFSRVQNQGSPRDGELLGRRVPLTACGSAGYSGEGHLWIRFSRTSVKTERRMKGKFWEESCAGPSDKVIAPCAASLSL